MKKLLFLSIAILSVIISVAQKPIIIKGKIDNCSNRNVSYIQKRWFNTETLKEESKNFDFTIANDGTFRVKITESDNYYAMYWIHLGNEYTHLDLIAGDSIYMTLNGFWFDETINYNGRGAGRNNYQRDLFLEFWDKDVASKIDNGSDPGNFLKSLNSLADRRMKLLNRYWWSGDIDSIYYQIEKNLILNDKVNHVLNHNSRFHNHYYVPDSVKSQLDDILNAADFSDAHSLQHDLMRELVRNLPGYMVNRKTNKNSADLKNEIEYAADHYPGIINLYFDKEIIRQSLSQATNLSAREALLNFFDEQFDEPVLKKEIQWQQKNRIASNRLVNSNIFQNSLFIIFWFLVVVGLVFLTVRVIQYSIKNGVKINISLWLKLGFYLIVFFIAFAFVAQNNAPLGGLPFVFLLLGTFLIHTYFLIPQYALNKKWLQYALSLCAMLPVFVIVFFVSGHDQISLYSILGLTEMFFGLILLSWVSFYIHQMASGKSTLKNMVKNGSLNPELAIHLILFFLINFVFVINSRYNNVLNQALAFYTIILLFYFHTFFTYPRFFRKEKAAWFIGINVVILLGIAAVTLILDVVQSQNALRIIGIETKLSKLLSIKNIRFDLLLVSALILVPSFAYFFIKNQFINLESVGFKMYRKKEAELAQLRSQVNPHFLFNTLNTLYAFALKEGSEKTAECIAKLANLMRFMLDDMEKESILLQREVSYIQDYVKLQSIRSAVEHDIAITVDIEEEQGYSVAPMLLIPFVENAFKHGMNPSKVSHLKIDITGKDKQIQFVIENSIDENFEAYYKEKGFGIGIENVKSRLKYIYPNRHNISIAKTNGKFIVILTIEVL